MFIRRTQTRSRISGEPYLTYRLVQSERAGKGVKQSTVLNLGCHFDLPPAHWPALTRRIEEAVGLAAHKAKIGPSECIFRRIRRPIAQPWGEKTVKKPPLRPIYSQRLPSPTASWAEAGVSPMPVPIIGA